MSGEPAARAGDCVEAAACSPVAGAAGGVSAFGAVMMRLGAPGLETMASSSDPLPSFGTEMVATSSEVWLLPSLPVALSTSWWSPGGSGLSRTAAKSPLGPTSVVVTSLSPSNTSSLLFGAAEPAITVEPSGSTRRTSKAGSLGPAVASAAAAFAVGWLSATPESAASALAIAASASAIFSGRF